MTALESQKAVKIRGRVLGYFRPAKQPVYLTSVLESLSKEKEMQDVTEADIRDVVMRLVASGKLMYTPDMRISIGK
jgi:hypothetical protein